jgi:hypothetical protein
MQTGEYSVPTLIDRLMPASVLEKDLTLEEKIRARVILGLLLSNAFLCFVVVLAFVALQILTDSEVTTAIIAISGALVVVVVEYFMFWQVGSIAASAIMYSATYFAALLTAVILTGGWESPVNPLFLCAPVISFLVGGKQEGFYMGFLVFVVGMVMMMAHMMDFQLFQIMREENMSYAKAAIWVMTLVLLVTAMYVYDSILESFSQKERRNAPRG